MKPLVIYHGNCADGFGAAWVFARHGDQPFDFYPGVYQEPPPDVTGRRVYLVDFSYKRAVVEQMLTTAENVTLLDHHVTALEDLKPLFDRGEIGGTLHCTTKHSGAMIAWNFWCHGVEPPPLLRCIEDRDLWRFDKEPWKTERPFTRAVQANVFSYPYDFEVWDRLMITPIEELAREGAAIERKHFKDIDELVKVCVYRRWIGNWKVPVASLPYTLTSDAGHLMAEHEPFAACYWDTPGGRVYSLRSTDDGLDVSEIAKKYGGGGHPHAAGFRVPLDHELARPPEPDL